MQENLAAVLRAFMKAEGYTLSEFADKLEISRSTLQEYLKAQGNPCIAMVEQLAQKMGIDPAVLLTSRGQSEISGMLLERIPQVSAMDVDEKRHLIELVSEMVLILSDSR